MAAAPGRRVPLIRAARSADHGISNVPSMTVKEYAAARSSPSVPSSALSGDRRVRDRQPAGWRGRARRPGGRTGPASRVAGLPTRSPGRIRRARAPSSRGPAYRDFGSGASRTCAGRRPAVLRRAGRRSSPRTPRCGAVPSLRWLLCTYERSGPWCRSRRTTAERSHPPRRWAGEWWHRYLWLWCASDSRRSRAARTGTTNPYAGDHHRCPVRAGSRRPRPDLGWSARDGRPARCRAGT